MLHRIFAENNNRLLAIRASDGLSILWDDGAQDSQDLEIFRYDDNPDMVTMDISDEEGTAMIRMPLKSLEAAVSALTNYRAKD